MRKFISILSAAALAASVIVVPMTVSADGVYTYDGSDVTGWTAGDSNLHITSEKDTKGAYAKITTTGNSTYSTSLALPETAQLSDNYVIEYDVMIHQSNGMQRFGRYNQIAFASAEAAKDTRDFGTYGAAYNEVYGSGGNTASETGQGYTTGVASSVTSIWGIKSAQINATNDTALAVSEDDTGMVTDTWYRVQAAVSGETAVVTVIGANGDKIVDAADYTNSASALSKIFVTVGRGDEATGGGGVVALDNIRIYAGAAEELTADGLRTGDEEPVTDEPETVEVETVAEIDFDNTTADVQIGRSMTAAVVDGADEANTTKVLEIAGSSSNNNNTGFAYATIDLTEYTEGKERIVVDYDAYISSSGRMIYTLTNVIPAAYGESGLFKQGYAGSSATNAAGNAWMHTTVDMNVKQGKGTYTVTNGETTVASGSITSDKLINYLAFISWSPNTSYIDNITIKTGGEYTPAEPTPKPTLEPEEASTEAGSDITITGGISVTALNDMSAAEASAVEGGVLNHAEAKAAQTGRVSMYTDKNIKSNSYYAAFDINLTPSSNIKLQPAGSSDLSTQFVLSADEQGEITVSWIGEKNVETKSSDKLVHGTWYRVLVEAPQTSAEGTDPYNFYVYRINKADPTQVSEIAAQFNSVAVRNISGKKVTRMEVSVSGDVYIDNGTVFTANQGENLLPPVDTRTTIADYDFENDVNPFALAVEGRGVLSVVSAEDDEIVTSGKALKFAADENGARVTETAKLDYSAAAVGAESVTISFDSYIPALNAQIKNTAKDGSAYITQGYATGYYRINGNSGSAYTSAADAWVKTVIGIDLNTGKASYVLYDAEGTQLTSGSNTKAAYKAGTIQLDVSTASSVIYIDNLTIKAQLPEAAELTDSTFTDNAHASTVAVDGSTAPAAYDGTVVRFNADESTGDSDVGANQPAKSTYDISAVTAGKSDITISYDSYVSDKRVNISVDNLFSQGRNHTDYYVINGETNSKYTGAAGVWVHTVLNIDLNSGKETYTLTWGEDGKYSGSKNIDAAEVKAIVFNSTAQSEAYIANIKVTALGTYVAPATDYTKYVATYTDGVLTNVTAETVTEPAEVEVNVTGTDNGDGTITKTFLWLGMTPYVAEAEAAEQAE